MTISPIPKNHADLISAIDRNDVDAVKDLLAQGVDPNASDRRGGTLMGLAAAHGYGEIVRLFLKVGADIDQREQGEVSALMRAAYNGRSEMVQLLLDKGADVNITNDLGWAALAFSVFYDNNADVIRLLVDNGADLDHSDINGYTALTFAKNRNYQENAQLLKELADLRDHRLKEAAALEESHAIAARNQALLKAQVSKLRLKGGPRP
jgi:ankyrin repeat protein